MSGFYVFWKRAGGCDCVVPMWRGLSQQAWNACRRGDIMLRWAVDCGANMRDATLAACACARLVLPYVRGNDAELAIATAEQWAHGDESVTLEDVRAACDVVVEIVRRPHSPPVLSEYHARGAAMQASCCEVGGLPAAAEYVEMAAESFDGGLDRASNDCANIVRRFWPKVPK